MAHSRALYTIAPMVTQFTILLPDQDARSWNTGYLSYLAGRMSDLNLSQCIIWS